MASVRFLDPVEAWARVRAASFWSTVQTRELLLRYGVRSREEAWAIFRTRLRPFSPSEQTYLQDTFARAGRTWEAAVGLPFPGPVVCLAKLPAGMDWDYPYTLSDTIFIPERLCHGISEVTLLHESLHIWQRQHPNAFAPGWHAWGFVRHNAPWKALPVILDRWVSNPDAWDNLYWSFGDEVGRWCLVCELDDRGKPSAAAYGIHGDGLDPQNRRGEAELVKIFGNLGQLYHPYEILAKHLERWLMGRDRVPTLWKNVLADVAQRYSSAKETPK